MRRRTRYGGRGRNFPWGAVAVGAVLALAGVSGAARAQTDEPVALAPALPMTDADRALLAAAEAGDVDAIRAALERGARADARTENFATPLMRAAYAGKADAARVLLEAGADPLARNAQGMSVLFVATMGPWYENPPDLAARAGRLEIARLVLARGANARARDGAGQYPLHKAASRADVALIRLLLEHGATVWDRDANGETPLFRNSDAETQRVLLTARDANGRGAPVNLANRYGVTPLMVVSGDGTSTDLTLPRMVVEAGANVNARNFRGETLLHLTARHGNVELARFLLERGANPNLTDESRETPLLALELELWNGDSTDVKWRREFVRLLLEKGANPNLRDAEGNTALLHLAASGDLEVVQLLAAHGANLRVIGPRGWTVLHSASHKPEPDLIRWLIARNLSIHARLRPLPVTNQKDEGNEDEGEEDASQGYDDAGGETPLHMAAFFTRTDRHREGVRALLEAGADPNQRDDEGETSLHYAVYNRWNAAPVIPVLLEGGADPNARDRLGATPLYYAVTSEEVGEVRLLLAAGANPNAARANGDTPLRWARRHCEDLTKRAGEYGGPGNEYLRQARRLLALLEAATEGRPLPPEEPSRAG